MGVLGAGKKAAFLGAKEYDGRGVLCYHVNFYGQTGWVSSKHSKLC